MHQARRVAPDCAGGGGGVIMDRSKKPEKSVRLRTAGVKIQRDDTLTQTVRRGWLPRSRSTGLSVAIGLPAS